MTLEKCGWFALVCLMLSTAHADSTNRHSVMLSAQGDENDNRQWLSKLALPLGDRTWVQGSVGKSELAGAGAANTRIIGAALGVEGDALSAALEFVHRDGNARLEQQDWAGTLDWRGARGGLGAEVYLRSANGRSTTNQRASVFSSPVSTTASESVDCTGFGLHGHLDLTLRAKVFAGATRYRCDFEAHSAATSSGTPLSFLLGTDTPLSGVWRDEALIESSYRVGGSYRFPRAALSAQYLRDRTARTGEILDTAQFEAGFPVFRQWVLSPMIGYSSGKRAGHASFGGLSITFNW